MTAPNVLTLDHAPIVGKTYLVPTIETSWEGDGVWPLMTPAPHSDMDGLWDWHLDYRFLTAAQERVAAKVEAESDLIDQKAPASRPEARWTGSRASRQFTIGRIGKGADAFPPVKLRPLVCRRPTVAPEPLCRPFDLSHLGDPAVAISTPDGRHLCPHQKMDLTHWPRECDGTVICPLHRLRVKVPANG